MIEQSESLWPIWSKFCYFLRVRGGTAGPAGGQPGARAVLLGVAAQPQGAGDDVLASPAGTTSVAPSWPVSSGSRLPILLTARKSWILVRNWKRIQSMFVVSVFFWSSLGKLKKYHGASTEVFWGGTAPWYYHIGNTMVIPDCHLAPWYAYYHGSTMIILPWYQQLQAFCWNKIASLGLEATFLCRAARSCFVTHHGPENFIRELVSKGVGRQVVTLCFVLRISLHVLPIAAGPVNERVKIGKCTGAERNMT